MDGLFGAILGLLPLLPLALLIAAARRRHGNRRAMLLGANAWALGAVAMAEGLGLVSQINAGTIAAGWIVFGGAAAVAYLRVRRRPAVHGWRITDETFAGRAIAVVVGAVLLVTLVTALLTPPNNWDAMTYHMPRVVYWMQHGTLAHYPTHYLPQLHHPPGAEIFILHFQVLTGGGDRYANFVQWLAFAGAVATASLVAKQLGASPRGEVAAAAFVASLPMAALQATNAQNDLAVGFWVLAFASFLLWGMEQNVPAIGPPVIAAGAALGLAILTKSTAYLYAFPLCVWFAVAHLRKFGTRAVPAGIVIALLLVAINVGHGVRNARLYGMPLGPKTERFASGTHSYTNSSFTPGHTVSNVMRNVAVHALTPSRPWGVTVVAAVTRAHEALGLDVNDQATTWEGDTFRLEPRLWAHSDVAPAPLHLVVLAAVLLSWPAWRKRLPRRVGGMLACVVAAFLLFCIVIRWQPWHARLHLTLWLLAAAPAGTVLALVRPVATTITAILLAAVWPVLAMSNTHRLVGEQPFFRSTRFEQYFSTRPTALGSYHRLAETFAGQPLRCVGLIADEDEYVYPLWVILHAGNPAVRIENLEVKNESARLKPAGEPCAPEVMIVLRAARGEVTVRPATPDQTPR